MNLEQVFQKGSFRSLIRAAFGGSVVRRAALPFIRRKAWETLVENDPYDRPFGVRRDKYDIVLSMLDAADKGLRRGYISHKVLGRIFHSFLDHTVLGTDGQRRATERLGFEPPFFITVSPGKRCNLHCTGCYACSDSSAAAKLDWATFERIIKEKEQLWGSYFIVISGGEPFLWEDGGRGLLDMAESHPSEYFLVYTNGTFITKPVAERLADLGNLTPAISVEGFEEETDRRRGKGVHRRILQAMKNLREVGVPFGISVTGTRDNAEIIMSDEFVDFYFDEQGATYGWIFQYMPIGRRHSLAQMVTPEQRLMMYERTWRFVRERKVFVADFWNSGTLSSGCIAAGRPGGGYFYITWDGTVTPCVFIPYSTENIYDIFRSGENLDTILHSPLFKRIRRWQDDYGFARPAEEACNWLCPCVIRDHFGTFLHAVQDTEAKPIDEEAAAALGDPEYHAGMIAYGNEYDRLTETVWSEHYLSSELVRS